MEISTVAGTLLQNKGREMWTISPEAMVYDAIHLMNEKKVGALPVMTTSCHWAAVFVVRTAVPLPHAVVFGFVGKPASVSC